LWVEMCDWGRD